MSSAGAELTVYGLVQGVGFRYFTMRKALEYKLTGWVKNNPDGSVSASVEGDKGLIKSFIAELNIGPRHSVVSKIDWAFVPYMEKFKNFEIR